jgi:transcriptional regulator with XRE-family HTH domain
VSLRAIVKTNRVWIQIRGVIPGALLDVLRQEYGRRLIVRCEWGEQKLDILNAPVYEQEPKEMNPGAYLKFFRQVKELSQVELGRKLGGMSRQNVCDMENGRRPISRMMALRLSRLFEVSPDKFVGQGRESMDPESIRCVHPMQGTPVCRPQSSGSFTLDTTWSTILSMPKRLCSIKDRMKNGRNTPTNTRRDS